MRIPDFLRMNNWNIRKFSIVTLSLLIAYDGTFLMNKFLFDISILPQLLGFIVLTFIPGFVILRILKVHNIDRVTNFLLAVGLSLSFIMIYGLLLNTLLPHLGILKPMSPQPLFYAFNIGILALLLVSYLRDRGFKPSSEFLNVRISPLMLSLLLLPFLSIFGAYVMTFYDSNILILILLFLVSLVPLAVTLGRIPEKFYSLLIFIVSLSVLYHTSLISTHIWGSDQFFLTYSANWVLENGIWDPKTEFTQLLLICLLAPTYSLLCNLNIVWVFKIIFPFIYSLMPLALYQIYQNSNFGDHLFDEKNALLAALIPVFFYVFYRGIPMKQCIAKLFVVLVILTLTTSELKNNRMFPAIFFCFSLVVSHYGVSYLFAMCLLIALTIAYVFKKYYKNNFFKTLNFAILRPNFVTFLFVMSISWYIYVGNGTIFDNMIHIGSHFINSLSEIFQPEGRTAIDYALLQTSSVIWNIYKLVNILLQVFILCGVLKASYLLIMKKVKVDEVLLISFGFYAFYILGVTRSFGMGFDRILDITLILLSPLALHGFFLICKTVTRIDYKASILPLLFFASFLLTFFLFNSALIFEITNETLPPYAIALDRSCWDKWGVFTQREICGAEWIKKFSTSDKVSTLPTSIAKDGLILSIHYRHIKDFVYFDQNTASLPSNLCVYLSSKATEDGLIPSYNMSSPFEREFVKLNKTVFYSSVLQKASKVYDNGGSTVYYTG